MSSNRWILGPRELPILQVIEQIHSKLIAEFEERRLSSIARMAFCSCPIYWKANGRSHQPCIYLPSSSILRSGIWGSLMERSDIINIGTLYWLLSWLSAIWNTMLPSGCRLAALISCRKEVHGFMRSALHRKSCAEDIHRLKSVKYSFLFC